MNLTEFTFPVDSSHAPELAEFVTFFNSQQFDERRRGLMFLLRKTIFDLDSVMPTASPDERESMFQGLIELHNQLKDEAALAESVG